MTTAAQFSAELDGLRHLISSVVSAKRSELDAEILSLNCRVTEICSLKLGRRNDRLEERRRELVRYACEVVGNRQEAAKTARHA